MLTQCPALERLDLNRKRMGAGGTDSLAGVLGQCTVLTHLDLNYNWICKSPGTEEKLAGVLVQYPALVHLNLSDNAILFSVAPYVQRDFEDGQREDRHNAPVSRWKM